MVSRRLQATQSGGCGFCRGLGVTLRAGAFRCPARVVQPCKAKVVQPRRSQPGSTKLAADHLAPIGEEALNPRCIELLVDRADAAAPASK